MNLTILTYSLYLAISIGLTIWMARMLSKNGRVFLVECFRGNDPLADNVNQLLIAGFYLVNLGFIIQSLNLQAMMSPLYVPEVLTAKIGSAVLMLGVTHFLNIFLLTKIGHRGPGTRASAPMV